MGPTTKNLLCVFCYKKPGKYFAGKKYSSSKFISLLGKYLRVNLNVAKSNADLQPRESFVLCEDCSHLGNTFCDFYFQLERLKMEMDWKVKMFCDTMILARKVPSRYVAFKEQFGWSKSQEEFQRITDFRTTVIKHCKQNLKSNQPRLHLRRIDATAQYLKKYEVTNLPPLQPIETSNRPGCVPNKIHLEESKIPPNEAEITPNKAETPKNEAEIYLNETTLPNEPEIPPNQTILPSEAERHPNEPEILPNETTFPNEPETLPKEAVVDDITEGDYTDIPTLSFHLLNGLHDETELHQPDHDPLQLEPEEEDSYLVENNDEYEEMIYQYQNEEEGAMDIEFKVVKHPAQHFEEEQDMEIEIEADNADEVDDMEDIPSADEKGDEDEDDSDYEPEEMEDDVKNQSTEMNSCGKCKTEFSCEAATEKHRVLVHKVKNYVRCPICTRMFGGFHKYRRHRTLRHRGNKCHTYEKKSLVPASVAEYPIDDNYKGTGVPFFCPRKDCYEVFHSEPKLRTHLSTHGVWNCEQCSAVFEKAHRLASHEVETHKKSSSDGIHKCSRCRATFKQKDVLTEHFLQKHLGLEGSKCKTRSQSQSSSSGNKGSSILAGGGPKACPICKIGLPPCDTREVLQAHVKKYHYVGDMDPSEISKCEACQAPFTSRALLDEHFSIVHDL